MIPAEGRGFLPEEDREGGADVAIISDGFWHSHFGAAPDLIGQTIPLDGKSVTVVGVLPASFHFPFAQPEPDVWLPRVFDHIALTPVMVRSGASYLVVFARLQPGEALAQSQAELEAMSETYAKDFPGYVDASNYSLQEVSLKESLVGPLRVTLLLLLSAVGFVLLIGCTNIASMLLARSTTRQKEIAIRQALGASSPRLMRQLLTESVLLSALGGILGVVLAAGGLRLLRLLPPGTIPRIEEVSLNGGVLIFSLVLCVVTGVAFGLVPSLLASHRDVNETLKESGRGSNEGRKSRSSRAALVVVEVAIAVVLVTGAGLLMKSFGNLMHVDPGFSPTNVTTFLMTLPKSHYPQPAQQAEFYRRLVESVQTLPGVQSAGVSSFLPLAGAIRYVYFCPEGMVCQGIGKDPVIAIRQITPDYLQTMRIPLLRGRVFNQQDIAGVKPVVIINETVAQKYFPAQDADRKTSREFARQNPNGNRRHCRRREIHRAEHSLYSRNVYAAGAESCRHHDACRPLDLEPAAPDRRGPPENRGDRSRFAFIQHCEHERSRFGVGGAASPHHAIHGIFRRAGFVADGCRHLRRVGLFRHSEHPRNGHTHGAGGVSH